MKGFVDHNMGPGSVGFLFRFVKGNRATFSVSRQPNVAGGEPLGVARVGESKGWNAYQLVKLEGEEAALAYRELEGEA